MKTGASLNRGRSKQDYGTPKAFMTAVERRFGSIVCDLAADAHNTKSECWYGEDRDSLTVPWALENPEGTLWLNPPFSDITPWAAKCSVERLSRTGLILLLTPASIGTEWFASHVHGQAMVLGLSPRLTFEGTTDPYPKDLMLSVFGYGMSGFDLWRWDGER